MEEDKELLNINVCPECGCDYIYDVGYGVMECFQCLNKWKQ